MSWCNFRPMNAFNVLCAQLTRDLFAIAKFLLLLVTAASDLLVHKILLKSVVLSPIVSGGVRPKLPRQTPLSHNSPCLLPFVGRLGSRPRLMGRIGSGVRVSVSFQQHTRRVLSYDVPRQQKTDGVMTKGV